MSKATAPVTRSFFHRLHAGYKLVFCIFLAALTYFILPFKQLDKFAHAMLGFDVFALSMLVMSWISFFTTESHHIREEAKREDSSRLFIFIIVLISTFAGLFAVLLLIITKNEYGHLKALHLPIAITGMMFSWMLMHTVFTFRYAHLFFGNDEDNKQIHAGGLEFPGEKKPDFLDFAYFSFVLGMTFQVSDVVITSKRLRRLALLHGLVSFGYNTIIVALTINVVAGLGDK